MNFVKHLRTSPVSTLIIFAHLSFLILLIGIIYFLPFIVTEPVFRIEQPSAVTSDLFNSNDVVVVITSENILYLDKNVLTLTELNDYFHKNSTQGVYLKVDRRSSIGRIMDVWNLARTSGIQRVSIASD